MPASDLPPAIICKVTQVVDADTIRCGSVVVRLAGLSALERSGRCNSAPDCATMPYPIAKAIATRIALGRTYRFRIYGRSGKRLVGDAPTLRCDILSTGAAVTWGKYARRYKLRRCL